MKAEKRQEGRAKSEAELLSPLCSPLTSGRAGGRLWVVATPIGNLGDLSPRARDVLEKATAILAEDTRRVRKLLTYFGISTRARAFHEHNEAHAVPGLLAELAAGGELALVSDAGMPLLSDPGYRLVRACRQADIPVLTVPGPSAVTAAVAVSGLPPVPFTFAGFLPARAGARRDALAAHATTPHTLVIFLSPHRLAAELAACASALGGAREAVLLAELTKLHERCERGTLDKVAAAVRRGEPRGEYTLVVGPAVVPSATAKPSADVARTAVDEALARGLSLPEARRETARRLGLSRKELYALLTPRSR